MDSHKVHLFVHVPKTAGTSFRTALEGRFPGRVICDYGLDAPETSQLVRTHVYERKSLAELQLAAAVADIAVVAGHFYYKKYASIFTTAQVITFLREPIARVVSEYEHACRHQDVKQTLLEYAGSRRKNFQSSLLRGVPLGEAAFVGITERYAESLALLSRKIGWTLPEMQLNVNPKHVVLAPGYAVTPDEEAQLREWNALDIAHYQEALERFDAAAKAA